MKDPFRWTFPVIGFALGAAIACDGASADDDDSNTPRCQILCDEDNCGTETSECVSECVAQSEGLESLCAQCLVDESVVRSRWLLGDGDFCIRNSGFWALCDADGDCVEDSAGRCSDDLPPGCSLDFGEVNECKDFCG